MKRDTVLDTAKSLVCGDRQEQHGSATVTYRVVANLWTDYIRAIPRDRDISQTDVFHMLALMKIGRALHNPEKGDNYVDACGYMALAGEEETECSG